MPEKTRGWNVASAMVVSARFEERGYISAGRGGVNCGSRGGWADWRGRCPKLQWFTRIRGVWNRYGMHMESVLRVKWSGLSR
jgi:hypothetical protein